MRPRAPVMAVRRAVDALHCGGVIAYPTEAVWGLGCDPANETAVMELLALKNRPVGKGLILVAGRIEHVHWLISDLEEADRGRLEDSWPGPNTWLVPHFNKVPPWIHGDHDTVAIRVSAHPVVQALCDHWGGVLVSTSANPAGAAPAIRQHQVRRYFNRALDCIVPGLVGKSAAPSRIVDLATDRVIRS